MNASENLPKNKIFLVQLLNRLPAGADCREKIVAAQNERAAIIAVFTSIGEADPIYQAAGIEVQCYELNKPVILK
jgi:hypothetical protein